MMTSALIETCCRECPVCTIKSTHPALAQKLRELQIESMRLAILAERAPRAAERDAARRKKRINDYLLALAGRIASGELSQKR